jgi:hypothetical protein
VLNGLIQPFQQPERVVGFTESTVILAGIPSARPIPGANGQGCTKDEARQNLAEAIALILADRREDGLRGVPPDAERDTVIVK